MLGAFTHATQDVVARSVGDDAAALEDDDAAEVAQHAHLVGDDDQGGVLRTVAEDAFGHVVLELRVHRRGGLVEQHHARARKHQAGDAHELALAARQAAPPLADLDAQALGVAGDQAVQPGEACGVEDLLVGGGGQAQRQILAQRALKQAHVLRQIAHVLADELGCEVCHVDVVEKHAALGGAEQARQHLDERALARAHRAQHGHPLARLHTQRIHGQCRRVLGVAEAQGLHAHAALAVVGYHAALAGLGVGRHRHDAVERLQRDARVLPLHDEAGHLSDRPQRTAADDGARDQAAHGEVAVADGEGAGAHQADVAQLLQGLGEVGRQRGDVLHRHLVARQGVGERAPAVEHLPFGRRRLHRLDAIHRLDQQAVLAVRLLHVRFGQAREPSAECEAGQHRRREEDRRHDRHRPGDQPDHDDEQDGEGRVGQHEQRGCGHEVAHRLEVPDLRRKRAYRARAPVHADRQRVAEEHARQLLVDGLAAAIDEAVADLAHC